MHKVLAIILAVIVFGSLVPAQERMTDATWYGLKGKVQKVATERSRMEWKDGKWKATPRTVSGVSTWDPKGRHLTNESYAFQGMSSITTYLEIDGVRAMKSKEVESSPGQFAPPPMPGPPVKKTQKPDPRYDIKYLDTYDEKGNRTEVLLISNDGRILSLLTYKYDERGNKTESAQWTELEDAKRMNRGMFPPRKLDKLSQRTIEVEGRKLAMVRNSQTIYKYDGEGKQTDTLSMDDDGNASTHVRYAHYEFDASKNWTKRASFLVEMKAGKEELTPEAIEYQAIKYHP